MNTNSRRSYERLFYFLISLVLLVNVARAQAPALTTITDTIYRADGTPLIPAGSTEQCAACHLKAGAQKGFVFRQRSWE